MRGGGPDRAAPPHVETLVLDGAFDPLAIARARRAVAELSEQDHLVLDIGKVRDVDWCALASLAAEVAELAPGRVLLTGYSEQHARLLTYLELGALLAHAPSAAR